MRSGVSQIVMKKHREQHLGRVGEQLARRGIAEGACHRVLARGVHRLRREIRQLLSLQLLDPDEEERHRRAAEERQDEQDDALGAAEALAKLTLRDEANFGERAHGTNGRTVEPSAQMGLDAGAERS